MNKVCLQNQKGFTLVESIMYVALIGAVIASFIGYGMSVSSVRSKTYVIQEVQENLRGAVGIISSKIKQADSIILPAVGASSTILTLDMPDPSPNLLFSLSDGVLYLTEGAGTPVAIISDEVSFSNLSFSNYGVSGGKASIRIIGNLEFRENDSIEYRYSQGLRIVVNNR